MRSREPYSLDVDGLVAEVRRKPMRTLRMVLRPPSGSLHVSAPLRAAESEIRDFIRLRRAWIEAQRLRMAKETPEPKIGYVDGESIPFFARTLTLRVVAHGKTARARQDGPETLLLTAPADATRARREAAVWRWYGRELLAAAGELLPARQTAMGVSVARLRVRAMRSRWGSCSIRSRTVTLALELARRPPEGLDYVLVHELAHLLVRSHGKRFKSILDRHMPDWRARRKALNQKALRG